MHDVLVNRLGGLSLPRKSVVRLTDRPDMTLDVYRGRKTTTQQQCYKTKIVNPNSHIAEILTLLKSLDKQIKVLLFLLFLVCVCVCVCKRRVLNSPCTPTAEIWNSARPFPAFCAYSKCILSASCYFNFVLKISQYMNRVLKY